jgi:hypothetical protein
MDCLLETSSHPVRRGCRSLSDIDHAINQANEMPTPAE